jgi:hypothetical protein
MRCRPIVDAVSVPLFIALLLVNGASDSAGQSSRKPASRSQNVQAGSIAAVDAGAGTLTLKPKSGADIVYHLTDKTRILKDKKPAEAAEFKPGDSAVVRYRKSTAGPASLYDLADKVSWEWLDRLRHETTSVSVIEFTEDTLKAAEGKDKAEVDYRITEKTTWRKRGAPAAPGDFKAGDVLLVVPRMLPGGGIMATAVSDGAEGAALLKERTKTSVPGTVRSLDAAKHILLLHTAAGEDREIALAPDVIVRQAAKDVPLTSVHAGQLVSVRLSRNSENELTGSRITIQSRKSAAKKPAPAKLPAKAPIKP